MNLPAKKEKNAFEKKMLTFVLILPNDQRDDKRVVN